MRICHRQKVEAVNPMSEFEDPENQTQISPRATYWFWFGVTCFNACFGFLLLQTLQLEMSLPYAWSGAALAAVAAGALHYAATGAERHTALGRQVDEDV
jgi:hypothetical protein